MTSNKYLVRLRLRPVGLSRLKVSGKGRCLGGGGGSVETAV
jgi:hypothetical protein